MEAAAWGPVERKQHGHLLYWEDIVKTLVPPPHLLHGQHNVTNMTNMTDKTKITNMTLVTCLTGKILSRHPSPHRRVLLLLLSRSEITK